MACWTARRPREHSGSVSDLHGSVARPGGLLAMLLGSGLVRQPEVVETRSVAWLCSLPGARRAMNTLIAGAGLEPGENPSWYAEVRAVSGARTDLECWWGEPPLPRVVVEAKLGAPLVAGQIGLLRAFRTAKLVLIHAASCRFRYSLWTSCGVL